MPDAVALGAALLAGAVFGGVAYGCRLLTASGAVAGALFGVLLLAAGGWRWAVPAVVFFGGSALVSRAGRGRKADAAARAVKGDVRDAVQVGANGGVAALLLAAQAAWPSPLLYAGFLGALAAAAADTWATEVGTAWGGTPRHILTLRPVPAGTSGAVSVVGLLGSVAGAASVAVAAAVAVEGGGRLGVVVLAGGVLGALADSLAGATVQARYEDPATGGLTEHAASAAGPHRLAAGRRWMTNDAVNLLCTAVGAAAAVVLAASSPFAWP